MANTFLQLPAPAANAAGVAVDVSGLGASKTIVVAGHWRLTPNITIEVNNDPAQAGSWSALETFQGGDVVVREAACMWMRARVSNFRGGQAPEVWVGAMTEFVDFAALPATLGNGAAAAVDVSALGAFKTVQVGGTFAGATIIEVSEDGGFTWGQPFESFQSAGLQSLLITADFMRVRRVGVPTLAPGFPIVNVGATMSNGPTGIAVDDEGVPLGLFQVINFVGPGISAVDAGSGVVDVSVSLTATGQVMALPEQWSQKNVNKNQTDIALSCEVSTNFDTIKVMRPGSIVGFTTRFSEQITAGQATVEVTKNGAGTGLVITHTSVLNNLGGIALAPMDAIPYVAGDLIGMRITTNNAFLPTTTDLEAWIEVTESLQ